MSEDLKRRVEEVKRILNYERPDIQHASDMARVVYQKQDIQYVFELIKELTEREAKLAEALRFYADETNHEMHGSCAELASSIVEKDGGYKANDTLSELNLLGE